MEKENKIDAAIDQVLESKRLKQGVNATKKGLSFIAILGILFFILLLVGVALGIVK